MRWGMVGNLWERLFIIHKKENHDMDKFIFTVFASRQVIDSEDPENSVIHPYTFMGTTIAVSEEQAINNVRHNCFGETVSQYEPIEVENYYTTFIDWKAVKNERVIPRKTFARKKCARCGHEYEPFFATIRKCPYSKRGAWVCVYCCKACRYVKRVGTGFGCGYQQDKEDKP